MRKNLLDVGSVHSLTFRVQYNETDGQKRVHHANYLNYFERGRVEMLREAGLSYKKFEESGLLLVVTEMSVKYHAGAEFDDLLTLQTKLVEVRKVRLVHGYQIQREGEIVVTATSTIACVDSSGHPRKIEF